MLNRKWNEEEHEDPHPQQTAGDQRYREANQAAVDFWHSGYTAKDKVRDEQKGEAHCSEDTRNMKVRCHR